MTGLVNKVKDALSSKDHSSTSQPEGTHGHHSTRAANAADPRLDSDRDHRAAPGSTTGTGVHSSSGNYTSGTTGTTHGTGLAGENRGLDGPATKTDGPHKSNMANKLDPRIDSDRDASKNVGLNPSGTATTGSHSTTTTGTTHGAGTGLSSHGTHGASTTGTGLGSHGTHGTHGAGIGSHGTHGTTGTTGFAGENRGYETTGYSGENRGYDANASRTDGPHNSNVANKVDPRVDSDRDASRNLGANPHGTATTGTGAHSGFENRGPTGTMGGEPAVGGFNSGTTGTHTGTHGTHNTSLGGSGAHTGAHTGTHSTGLTGSGAHGTHGTHGSGLTGASTTATGPAPSTAGPHSSDMMNKIDPRVDSDLDNSKTVGNNNTYVNKDPTDAAQVPPSVLQKHVPVEIAHDDVHHDRAKRHSVSHQEEHRGL